MEVAVVDAGDGDAADVKSATTSKGDIKRLREQ